MSGRTRPGTRDRAVGWTRRGRIAKRIAPIAARVFPGPLGRRIRNPVLIVGCGRSGTTLLHELLASHAAIAAYPSEANELWHPSAYPWARATVDLPPIWADPHRFTEVSLVSRPSDHVRRLRAHFGAFQVLAGRPVLLNKSVMVNFMLPYVRDVFPNLRFIHIVRDGRAVAVSYARFTRRQVEAAFGRYTRAGYAWSFEQLAVRFAQYWTLTLQELERQKMALGPGFSDRWLEVRYEALCADPAAVLAQAADFLGVARTGYAISDYAHIVNMNARYQESRALAARLTAAAESALIQKGYA